MSLSVNSNGSLDCLDCLAKTFFFVESPVTTSVICKKWKEATDRSFLFILQSYEAHDSLKQWVFRANIQFRHQISESAKFKVQYVYQACLKEALNLPDGSAQIKETRSAHSSILSADRLTHLAQWTILQTARDLTIFFTGLFIKPDDSIIWSST